MGKRDESGGGGRKVTGSIDVAEVGAGRRGTPAGAEIVVVNDTGFPVWFVQVAPNGASEWGLESLDSGIAPGGDQHWNVPSGYYQLRAGMADDVTVTCFGVRVKEGQRAVWTLRPE